MSSHTRSLVGNVEHIQKQQLLTGSGGQCLKSGFNAGLGGGGVGDKTDSMNTRKFWKVLGEFCNLDTCDCAETL